MIPVAEIVCRRLDEGHPFLSYAARYITPDELESLNKNVDQTSLKLLFDSTDILKGNTRTIGLLFFSTVEPQVIISYDTQSFSCSWLEESISKIW